MDNATQPLQDWNTCLLFRNRQLTRELKELRSVSAPAECTSSQLLAMSQLLRLHIHPAYGIINSEQEWQNFFSLLDILYASPLSSELEECQLTTQELKLCYLVRARLKNKAIALLFNITTASVIKAKQRLKQKLGLHPADCLDNYLQSR